MLDYSLRIGDVCSPQSCAEEIGELYNTARDEGLEERHFVQLKDQRMLGHLNRTVGMTIPTGKKTKKSMKPFCI